MKTGIKGEMSVLVTEAMTAEAMGSGDLPVYATPSMIALMENTAKDSISGELAEGQGTVGTLMQIEHVSATPVGMKVRCETELVEVDRKRLVFEVKAFDEKGLIGQGRHERFVIDNERFLAKAEAKKN